MLAQHSLSLSKQPFRLTSPRLASRHTKSTPTPPPPHHLQDYNEERTIFESLELCWDLLRIFPKVRVLLLSLPCHVNHPHPSFPHSCRLTRSPRSWCRSSTSVGAASKLTAFLRQRHNSANDYLHPTACTQTHTHTHTRTHTRHPHPTPVPPLPLRPHKTNATQGHNR